MRERLENEILKNESIEKERTENELLEYIKNDNFEEVEAILKKYETNIIILNINKKDNDGNSLLYYATKYDNINIVRSFIKYAKHHNIIIKVNDKNNEGNYSFLNATQHNNIEMVKLLLDYSNENEIIININKQSSNKNYPLDNAVYHNNIEMVKLLIEYADNNDIILDINQKDDIGNSLIINTVSNIEMVQLFIEYSNRKNIILNINQQNDFDNYLLDLIIKNNNIEIFNKFINYADYRNINLNLNEENIEKYISKLNNNILVELKKYYQKGRIKIEFKENSELKKILVDENEYLIKANNNYLKENRNEYKFSFLMLACYFDDEKWVKRLINNNTDINIKNIDGDTPLTIACYFNNLNIVKLLIDNGADVNVENNDNETPSTISVNNNEVCKIIEEKKKIDVNNKQRNETKKPINYYQSNKEEMYTKYSGNLMDFGKLELIGNISVFKIKYENDNEIKTGTGFFVKLPMPSNEEPMYGLMTCNHVFSESVLKLNFKFKIYLNNEGKKIKLNESYFNGTNFIFTSPLIDITFIQLSDDLIAELGLDKDEHFLIPCMNYENIFNESVHAFQYPKDGNCKCDEKVKSLVGFDFFHNVSTDEESSGSPLLNNNLEIIGVHKPKNEDEELNIATDFRIIQYVILKLYNNKYIINIYKSRLSPKKLTRKEIKNKSMKKNYNNEFLSINDGDTFLTYACKLGNYKKIKNLIKLGIDINNKNRDGDSPLTIVCKNKNIEIIEKIKIIKYMLDNGANINIKDRYDLTPLMIACYFNNIKLVKFLIDSNSNINFKNKDGDTAITIARCFNNKDIIELLIKSKDNIDIKNNNNEIENITNYKVDLNLNENIENDIDTQGNNENLAIANYDFKGCNTNELNIKKGDKLIILDESKKEGWLYGYNINNSQKKGFFPKVFINYLNSEIKTDYNFSIKNPISLDEFVNVSNNSLCKIKYKLNKDSIVVGTGFLIKFPLSFKGFLYGLITNNHVIEYCDSNFEITIFMKNKNFSIKLNNSFFIFTSKLLDITFIQFTDDIINKINLNKKDFLCPYDKENEIGDNAYILQYPYGENIKFSNGIIKSYYGFNYLHTCLTYSGSSGSPLLNNDLKVIGVHCSKRTYKDNSINNIYIATKISVIEYAIRTLYNKRNLVGIEKINKTYPKILSSTEIEELKNHRIEEIKSQTRNLFKFSESNSSTLLFYRSNHAWYWTCYS
eukprot:jgi/Orpsp1_1/1182888/evm.model.c7180000083072.1